MIWIGLGKYRDVGLLLLRVGLGIAFMAHGWPKLAGGQPMWEGLGKAMPVPPAVAWGFLAACAEFFGGLLLALGLLFRPVCLALTIQMAVALASHLNSPKPADRTFLAYSHALEDMIVFAGLFFIGPGLYSVDRK